MRLGKTVRLLLLLLVPWWAGAVPALAQVTTATVTGNVKDAQGAVVPGATVTLTSQTRGTTLGETVTNSSGDYVFPNVVADTYIVQVQLEGFKTVRRAGITVSPGDRVAVPALTIEVGGLGETIEVRAETPLVQSQSGERSFTVATTEVENLPIASRNFATLARLTPGVMDGNQSGQQASRIGGGGQNNVMMDGVSTMDTGNNGQMLSMNVEAIAEVKVLTSAYQAEYGRSSGLQITAVTKSGSNSFRGSLYDVRRDSDWNSNSWIARRNGDPKAVSKEQDWGYSIGGPVGKPGGNNKLFFFYSHEYRPRTSSGAINRFRVPTVLERRGDFSQTTDNQGNLFNLIRDYQTGLPCTSANTNGCFQDGGVLGRIPQNRLYQVGLNVLKLWPEPNVSGLNYNLEIPRPRIENLIQQPAVRLDYQMSPSLRFTGKYAGQKQRVFVMPGTIPGFNDITTKHTFIHALSMTANYNLNATTFVEATYGWTQNRLAGGGAGGVLTADVSNRLNAGLGGLPLLYPDAGIVDPRYYDYGTLQDYGTPYFVDGRIMLPPVFQWGNRVANAPPNLLFPGWLNINRTQDFSASLTKVTGRHTVKGGFYLNHSFKAQNLNAGGGASFAGTLNFGNDNNNPIDTGFGFANAALGIFSSYQQQSKFIEGSYIYNNIEGYIQDNWKVNNRLTLDYGLRITHQQPQYDQFLQGSNFFVDQWSAAQAPLLYLPGCATTSPCSGASRQARDPRTGALLGAGSSALIGQIVPGTGSPVNGIRQAGDGISKYNYQWPALAFGPRFGAAYDLSGDQRLILRGGAGLFFDRPDGNSVFSQSGNPPNSTSTTVRYAELGNLGAGGLSSQGVPQLIVYRYDNDNLPSSAQWNVGVQMAMPWSSTFDVAYTGQRSFNVLNGEQAGGATNLNAIDLGAAFLPGNQDPTLPASAIPGARAFQEELLRPFRGYGNINQQTQDFWRQYHGLQFSWNRRFRNGFSGQVNYNLTLSDTGTMGVPLRLQHNADGSISVRDDQAAYNELLKDQNTRTHIIRTNFVWDLPDLHAGSGAAARVSQAVINDWQLSGILLSQSGQKYDIGYAYQSGGGNVNLTGSPNYGARVLIVGDPGSGCSGDPYRQFNTAAFAGPVSPSVGMESGRNYMTGCWGNTWDLAIARNFRMGGSRNLQVRLEMFNAFDTVVYTSRQTQLQLVSPTDPRIRNAQYNEDGSLNQSRLQPRNAGFGAVTGTASPRNLQLQIRFAF